MEEKQIQIQEQKASPKKNSSLIKDSKNGIISSKNSKNHKKKKKLVDISNQILVQLKYEDFDQETETFIPQFCKSENKISMNNVSLLDQNHFKFLVKENSNIFNHYTKYRQHNFDNISWNEIELVQYYCNDSYSCPICLESNLCCPVITKCGHIFCYPCIISLFNYHMNIAANKKIPICPLCNKKIENISDDEKFNVENNGNFKLCQKIKSLNYNYYMKIKFNLILKEKKSPTLYNLIYDPLLENWKNNFKNKMKDIPDEETKEFNFSRICLSNKLLLSKRLNEYKKELDLLKKEFDSTSDDLKKQSIKESINQIDKLILKNKNKTDIQKDLLPNLKNIQKNSSSDIDKDYESNSCNDIVEINYNKYHLFYQEEKGDIYYLDPLLMEILLTEYGDYNSLPVELEGEILDIEMKQVTSKLKSEYKYLNHLRIGSIIYFVEIDIKDLISSSTKKIYQEKLNERYRLRSLLKNQEKNYENFINKKNSKIFEDEKNSSLENSKKSLDMIYGPIFFGTEEELGKKQTNNYKNKCNNNEKDENKSIKESKLKLLFEENNTEEKNKEEKEEKVEKEKKKEKEVKKNKKIKNKKGGIKNNNGGKKGKKKKICDINPITSLIIIIIIFCIEILFSHLYYLKDIIK